MKEEKKKPRAKLEPEQSLQKKERGVDEKKKKKKKKATTTTKHAYKGSWEKKQKTLKTDITL